MKIFILALLLPIQMLFGRLLADDNSSSQVIGWGMNDGGQSTGVPSATRLDTNEVRVQGQILRNCIAIAAGRWQGLALKSDGTVGAWGLNYNGEATGTPCGGWTNGIVAIGGRILSNVLSVSAGTTYSLALLTNRMVVGWGGNLFQQLRIPAGLSNVVAISAGKGHSLALRMDGTVVGWPDSLATPRLRSLSNIVAIAATSIEWGNDVALRADGTVVQWNAQNGQEYEMQGLTNVIAIAAGGRDGHGVALNQDGTVADLLVDSSKATDHLGLSNVVSIAAGGSQGLALKKDGTIAAWAGLSSSHASVPRGLTNVVAIAAGEDFCLAIQTNRAGPITNTWPSLPRR